MPTEPMTNAEARAIFDQAVARSTTPDQRAKAELVREYFTNPTFRAAMADHVAALNGVQS